MTTPNKKTGYENDLEMARCAANGDRDARREVAERLYDRIRTAVYYLCGGHRDWEDWVQLALVEVLRSCGSFRGEGSLESWGNRIAIRVAMRRMTRRKFREKSVIMVMDSPFEKSSDLGLEARKYELRHSLMRVMGDLSRERRTAIVLRLVFEYSIDEIAEITEVPRDTVRNRLRHGRRQLKKRISIDPSFADWVKQRMS